MIKQSIELFFEIPYGYAVHNFINTSSMHIKLFFVIINIRFAHVGTIVGQ